MFRATSKEGNPSVTSGAYWNALAVLDLKVEVLPANADADTGRGEGWIPTRILLANYPQLKQLAWHVHGGDTFVLSPREALDIYERHGRHLDMAAMGTGNRTSCRPCAPCSGAPMPFERPHHQAIETVLYALDGELLRKCRCLFGGGTAIALRHGEFRESVDMDFLVSELAGYRHLRSLLSSAAGIAAITHGRGTPLVQAADIKADRRFASRRRIRRFRHRVG